MSPSLFCLLMRAAKRSENNFTFNPAWHLMTKSFFLSPHTPKERIGTLLTHEYHHVCRLHFLTKEEKDFTFLDTIMMEGLAEYAVYHRYGESYTAKWTTLYDESQLQRMYKKWVSSHLYQKVQDDERLIQNLLYGKGTTPKCLAMPLDFIS